MIQRSQLAITGFLAKVSLILSVALPVRAQSSSDSAAAQALFDQAKALMAKGNIEDACPKLEESQKLDPKSGTLLNLANCYEKEGKLASAWTRYLEAAPAARASGNPEREKVARDRANALAPRLAKLLVDVDPRLKAVVGLEILRDGVKMGPAQWGLELPSDVGVHKLQASAPGYKPWESASVVEGEGTLTKVLIPMLEPEPAAVGASNTGTLDLGPSSSAPQKASGSGPQRVIAVVLGGVGVVGLGVGTVFGLQAQSKKNEADKTCIGMRCPTVAAAKAGNDARSAGDLSTIGMAIGVLGLAGGVTLWLTSADDTQEGASLSAGFGSLQFKGAW